MSGNCRSPVRMLVCAAFVISASVASVARAAPVEVCDGIVVAVGKSVITIEQPTDLSRREVSVYMNTKITKNGNLARFGDLVPGDRVTVRVRPLGDKLLALAISAVSAPTP